MAATKTPAQPTPLRPVDSDPSMDEDLRRTRQLQAIAHADQAAAGFDEAGEPASAAAWRANAARMREAIAS
ncbi:hypothetical protein OG749_36185 [Streptomyces nojiriensis]|uniref:hypothetical protein n=1 Tax=Streptomyces nojiriensis TaxID=66374 RepID=UPI002E1733CE